MKISSVNSAVEVTALPPPLPRASDDSYLLEKKVQAKSAPPVKPVEEDHWDKADAPKAAEAEYSFDREANRTVIRIFDAETHDVIRETPPENMRKLAETLEKLSETPNNRLDCRA